ncbi:glycoside hydrolase family 76 protein [Delphinella strobiligena]|nr:glycoside hydrolase family 76 protein [Delphinella strobiligena]
MYSLIHSSSFLFLLSSINTSHASATDYTPNAEAAVDTLQQWYNQSTGLWSTTGWWNSANCLTVLANLAAVDTSVHHVTDYVFPTTLTAAQLYNLVVSKKVVRDLIICEYVERDSIPVNPNGFLNGYYDDEGWWALAWIQVFDVTGESQYLETASDIFEDMKGGWGTPCGGGIWWDKNQTYVNAITNELFLSVASHLANRQSDKQYYLDWAQKEWNWFMSSGMISSNSNINDGLDNKTCKNNDGTVWSYNQGVILGGLVELAKATNDISYLETANNIANAGITSLSDSAGILHDACEPNCGGDGSQFKGIFMRNLQYLQQASPSDAYVQSIQDNAISIWTSNRGSGDKLGLVWSGPYDNAANASTQSSALDALVAAGSTA